LFGGETMVIPNIECPACKEGNLVLLAKGSSKKLDAVTIYNAKCNNVNCGEKYIISVPKNALNFSDISISKSR
jgi:hypothetical protein